MAVKEPTGDLKKACWKGYTAVGMKMKNGRKVPNCVPANEEREIPLSHRTKHNVSHYRVLNNGRDVSKHDSYEEAIAHAGEHRRRLKSKGYDADKISVHAYVKEEKENYGLPAHSMKHVMQKIKDGHWEVSSGEVKSGQHLSIIDHTKGKKKRMIHVKEESNEPKDREWGTTKLTKRYKKDTPGQCDCNTMKEESDQITEDAKRDRVSADLHKQGIGSHWRNPQTLVVHDKHKKKVQQHMDKITGGWVHVVGHSEEPFDPMNEEFVVGVTLSHRDVKSGDKIFKKIRVKKALNPKDAISKAEKHYRKAGYKVHKDLSFIHSVNEEAGQMDERNDMWHPDPKVDSKMGGRAAAITQGKPTKKQMDLELLKRLAAAGKRIAAEEVEQMEEAATTVTMGRDESGYLGASSRTTRGGNPEKIVHLPVNRIRVHEPDTKFDDPHFGKNLENIKAALRRGEKLPPITVRRMPGEFLQHQVIDGHHRFKAYRDLGIKHIPVHIVPKYNVTDLHSGKEAEQMDEMKSSNPKGLAYKITAASHAANPSYGPHDPSVDPKTNFGAGATRSSAVAGLRAARAIKKAGGNPNDPEHIETISKAVHGSPADYGGKARGWSQHALTSTNQSPEQKERRSKLTGAYGGLSNDEQEKDRQIARVIANRVRPVKESVDLTKTLIKKIKAKGDTAYRSKKTGLLTLRKKSMKEEYADYIRDYGRSRRGRARAMAQHQADQKRSRGYQGYHTQIHVDGRHYKAGDRIGMGERGAQDAARHAVNIAKKTGKDVFIKMVHHETGKTLAIADYKDGKFKYRNLSEAAPIERKPRAGVEKLVSKMNPDTKAKTVSETRNIIREVIKKAVDKQETNRANGKTATGEPAPKIKIDPVIDLGARNV